MNTQNFVLNIGDEIGFVILANSVDSNDKTVFFPVAEICESNGERAYRYQYPDGALSHGVIRQSELVGHSVRINNIESEETMLCLSERKEEFMSALTRAKNSDMTVYADFERDNFVVVNNDNKSEYRVKLESKHGQFYAECDCPDFKHRHRICKHISEVLTETVFGFLARN